MSRYKIIIKNWINISMFNEKIDFKILSLWPSNLVSPFRFQYLGLKLMPFLFGTHLSVSVFSSLCFFNDCTWSAGLWQTAGKNFVWAGYFNFSFFCYIPDRYSLSLGERSLWVKEPLTQSSAYRSHVSCLGPGLYYREYQMFFLFLFLRKKFKAFWPAIQPVKLVVTSYRHSKFLCLWLSWHLFRLNYPVIRPALVAI